MEVPIFPVDASTAAGGIDRLYFVLLGLSGAIVVLTLSLAVYFAIRYRRGSRAPRVPRIATRTRRIMELSWTVVPFLIFLGLFGWAADLYVAGFQVPEGAMEVNVTARQWSWSFQHPEGPTESGVLHVPVDRPVRAILRSEDVIHSFFVPAFRVKRDAVPGRYTSVWFEATETGEFPLLCAEFCGRAHSRMRAEIVVMAEEDFATWMEEQTAATADEATPAEKGRKLFEELGCRSCHTGEGEIAPVLAELPGGTVTLQDGREVTADETYIRDSILRPQKAVVAGYDPVMPSFKGQVDDEQIDHLIAYLKSLDNAQEPGQ